MKNKRNTRRGRAKRWHQHEKWAFTRSRGGYVSVWQVAYTGEWKTIARHIYTGTTVRAYHQSKTAAYQCAEAWARELRTAQAESAA